MNVLCLVEWHTKKWKMSCKTSYGFDYLCAAVTLQQNKCYGIDLLWIIEGIARRNIVCLSRSVTGKDQISCLRHKQHNIFLAGNLTCIWSLEGPLIRSAFQQKPSLPFIRWVVAAFVVLLRSVSMVFTRVFLNQKRLCTTPFPANGGDTRQQIFLPIRIINMSFLFKREDPTKSSGRFVQFSEINLKWQIFCIHVG